VKIVKNILLKQETKKFSKLTFWKYSAKISLKNYLRELIENIFVFDTILIIYRSHKANKSLTGKSFCFCIIEMCLYNLKSIIASGLLEPHCRLSLAALV